MIKFLEKYCWQIFALNLVSMVLAIIMLSVFQMITLFVVWFIISFGLCLISLFIDGRVESRKAEDEAKEREEKREREVTRLEEMMERAFYQDLRFALEILGKVGIAFNPSIYEVDFPPLAWETKRYYLIPASLKTVLKDCDRRGSLEYNEACRSVARLIKKRANQNVGQALYVASRLSSNLEDRLSPLSESFLL